MRSPDCRVKPSPDKSMIVLTQVCLKICGWYILGDGTPRNDYDNSEMDHDFSSRTQSRTNNQTPSQFQGSPTKSDHDSLGALRVRHQNSYS